MEHHSPCPVVGAVLVVQSTVVLVLTGHPAQMAHRVTAVVAVGARIPVRAVPAAPVVLLAAVAVAVVVEPQLVALAASEVAGNCG